MAILLDIADSLRTIIIQKKISELPDENAIVLDSPADIEPNSNTRLSIFLYQIVENSYLKNIGPEYVLDEMHHPPLLVDLHYLFTPYAKNRETELIILERLMQVFYDNPVLKKEQLKGSLRGSGNDEIRIVPNNVSFEEINKLWERFPNKAFKLSVSSILTPVRIPSEKPPVMIKRVKETEIDVYKMGTM